MVNRAAVSMIDFREWDLDGGQLQRGRPFSRRHGMRFVAARCEPANCRQTTRIDSRNQTGKCDRAVSSCTHAGSSLAVLLRLNLGAYTRRAARLALAATAYSKDVSCSTLTLQGSSHAENACRPANLASYRPRKSLFTVLMGGQTDCLHFSRSGAVAA